MKLEKKKVFFIIAILLVLAIIIAGVIIIKNNSQNRGEESNEAFVKQIEDNIKQNVSKTLNQTKEFEGFKVSNIKLTEKDGEVILLADITNNTGKDTTKYTYFNITFFDEQNKEIGSFPGVIDKVKQNETTALNSSVKGDIANYINSYDFKLTVDKTR